MVDIIGTSPIPSITLISIIINVQNSTLNQCLSVICRCSFGAGFEDHPNQIAIFINNTILRVGSNRHWMWTSALSDLASINNHKSTVPVYAAFHLAVVHRAKNGMLLNGIGQRIENCRRMSRNQNITRLLWSSKKIQPGVAPMIGTRLNLRGSVRALHREYDDASPLSEQSLGSLFI